MRYISRRAAYQGGSSGIEVQVTASKQTRFLFVSTLESSEHNREGVCWGLFRSILEPSPIHPHQLSLCTVFVRLTTCAGFDGGQFRVKVGQQFLSCVFALLVGPTTRIERPARATPFMI
jgi:hypothetical protein